MPSHQNPVVSLALPPQARNLHPPFEYTSQQIRLLSFDPNGSFALNVFDISNCPDNIALSYTWSSPNQVDLISLNGHPFTIRRNLYLALSAIARHIQGFTLKKDEAHKPESQQHWDIRIKSDALSPGEWRYFWIDAICINQDDIQERNHQVQMMGDIYGNAVFVMVWFGPNLDDSFQHISTWNPHKTDLYDLFNHQDLPGKNFLDAFFGAAYWRRVWIVQEFVLARTLLFISDSRRLSWDFLSSKLKYWKYVTRWSSEPYGFAKSVLDRRMTRSSQEQNLPALIHHFQTHECSDIRDRVYGMLALVDWAQFPEIPVVADYSLEPLELHNLIHSTHVSRGLFLFPASIGKALGVQTPYTSTP